MWSIGCRSKGQWLIDPADRALSDLCPITQGCVDFFFCHLICDLDGIAIDRKLSVLANQIIYLDSCIIGRIGRCLIYSQTIGALCHTVRDINSWNIITVFFVRIHSRIQRAIQKALGVKFCRLGDSVDLITQRCDFQLTGFLFFLWVGSVGSLYRQFTHTL